MKNINDIYISSFSLSSIPIAEFNCEKMLFQVRFKKADGYILYGCEEVDTKQFQFKVWNFDTSQQKVY